MKPHNNNQTRAIIRETYRQRRRSLSACQQADAAHTILNNCIASTALASAKTVACYLANDGEISPHKIVEYCWLQKKRLLLPVLDPLLKGHLVFVDYQKDSVMQANRYGIQEPLISNASLCPLEKIDLIFAPLVAFDLSGNRLGMGGGYYDRTLSPIQTNSINTQLIGLAHSCQQATVLPADGWDIPLQGIATPEQFFSVG